MPPIRATRLEDIYKSVSPEPLIDREKFAAYYRPEINKVRGTDKIERMALGLGRALGGLHFKALLMGHSGVGKSTELTRLIQTVESEYNALRFSATTELDPTSLKPFDVILLIMAQLVEKTSAPVEDGGVGKKPSDARLKEIWDWFASEREILKRATGISGEIAAGVDTQESLWGKVLGLFGRLSAYLQIIC
jgi:hypothetical protein